MMAVLARKEKLVREEGKCYWCSPESVGGWQGAWLVYIPFGYESCLAAVTCRVAKAMVH